MYKKRKTYRRRNPQLTSTLVVLVISFAAALGGALYWDSVQKGDNTNVSMSVEDTEKEPSNKADDAKPEEVKDSENSGGETETQGQEPEKKEPERSPTIVAECDWVDSEYFADAAFVGDSLTQGIQLYDIIDTHVVANKGINLYTVLDEDKIRVAEGYTSVLKELDRVQPKKVYILLGANDVGWRDEENFKELYSNLVDAIQKQHPEAVIYLQSMFPVTQSYSDTDNGITNEKLTQYNKEVLAVAEEKGVYYLDVASAMADSTGALPDEVSPDGMHINGSYYQKWFDYLKTHVVPETAE